MNPRDLKDSYQFMSDDDLKRSRAMRKLIDCHQLLPEEIPSLTRDQAERLVELSSIIFNGHLTAADAKVMSAENVVFLSYAHNLILENLLSVNDLLKFSVKERTEIVRRIARATEQHASTLFSPHKEAFDIRKVFPEYARAADAKNNDNKPGF